MKTFRGIFSLIVMVTWLYCMLNADNRIVLYLRHAPDQIVSQVQKETGALDKAARSAVMPSLSGVTALYGGYMDTSSKDGLISFPLRHATPKVYLAITPRINLVKIQGNTYSHREYYNDAQNPVALYQLDLKKDDKSRQYWEIKKIDVPADKQVNPLTVILLADPSTVVIPEGKYMTGENVQLVFNDIYLLSRANVEKSLLQCLEISRFFEPIKFEFKKTSDNGTQEMVSNT